MKKESGLICIFQDNFPSLGNKKERSEGVTTTSEAGEININHQVWVKKLLPTLLQEKRMEWEKTIERSNRRRINIDCLAQVGIRHPGAKLTTLGREPRAEKNREKINQIIP